MQSLIISFLWFVGEAAAGALILTEQTLQEIKTTQISFLICINELQIMVLIIHFLQYFSDYPFLKFASPVRNHVELVPRGFPVS